MLNSVVLQGRLVRGPDLRTTQSGISVTSFTLAVNNQDNTVFIDCVAWKNTAEAICKYLRKGSALIVEGHLQAREWTDKDGNKRKSVEVNVFAFHFCERKSEGAPAPEPAGFVEIDDQDANLPF